MLPQLTSMQHVLKHVLKVVENKVPTEISIVFHVCLLSWRSTSIFVFYTCMLYLPQAPIIQEYVCVMLEDYNWEYLFLVVLFSYSAMT